MTDHVSFSKPFLPLVSVDALVILPRTTEPAPVVSVEEVDPEPLAPDQGDEEQ